MTTGMLFEKINNKANDFFETPDALQQNAVDTSIKKVYRFNWSDLKQKGYVSSDEPHSRVSEEFRSIKRPLVANAIGSRKKDILRSNLILITSSIPNEGKTYVSINLALSIAAELDKRVLLIDADVAKASVSRVLGIRRHPGLIEYLAGEINSFSEVIVKTEMEGLKIVPAGKRHHHATELYSSGRMIALAKELSARYDDRIVIFDTPPLLVATPAEALATLVGQVVLVIAADSTPQSLVLDSVKKLENCTDVVLALLNKAQQSVTSYGYGYGYGYGQDGEA